MNGFGIRSDCCPRSMVHGRWPIKCSDCPSKCLHFEYFRLGYSSHHNSKYRVHGASNSKWNEANQK